jgi:hypothetical protein
MTGGQVTGRLFFRVLFGCASALLVPRLALAHLEPVKDSEPNDTPATANPLTTTTTCFALLAEISPKGDLDYFSFTAPPGARLWAFLDTSISTASRDSILTLFGPDGTTQIDQDNNSGVGSNCDMTIETRESSAITGRALTAGGTYYLRVQAADPAWLITSYKLVVVVASVPTSAEVEPNDTAETATPIVVAGSPTGVRQGSVRSGEVDYYSAVTTAVGTLLEISLSGDPRRSGVSRLGLDLLQTNGAILVSVDNAGSPGEPLHRSVSFCFWVNLSQPYILRVRGLDSSSGAPAASYTLMVAECGLHSMEAMAAPKVVPRRSPMPVATPTPTPRSP